MQSLILELGQEKGCIINLGATIDRDFIIEYGVHLCVRCIINGENRISRCEKIEVGENHRTSYEEVAFLRERYCNGRT